MMRFWLCLMLSLLLYACHAKKEGSGNEIHVGTLTGADTQLMQAVQNVAFDKYGLRVNIIVFADHRQPNEALMKGDIDVNLFQHQPYLIEWNARHQGNLVAVAKAFIHPMGVYSYKVNRLSEINKGGVIAIPEDPTNQARALLLLQTSGLIRLRKNIEAMASCSDIESNPLQLQIKTVDGAKLPYMLPEVAAAVINNNYAVTAGLLPRRGDLTPTHKDAIYLESKNSLYANVFVVRPEEAKDPRVWAFIDAFQSPQVLAVAQTVYNGNAIKAW